MRTYFLVLLLSAAGLRADIEFSGFFTTSKEALFTLTETEGRHSSGWLKIGQSFGAYTIVSFDREHEVIALKQGERLLNVPLREAKVKSGRATITGSLKLMNDQVDGVRASLFFGEETSFPLRNGMIFRIKPEQLPDGNILYHAQFVEVGADGIEHTRAVPSVIAIPGKPFGIQMGEFGYSFAP
jgi:hypothetical protein